MYLDGTIARVSGKQSDYGSYLDILCDFTIYALIPPAIVIGIPTSADQSIPTILTPRYFHTLLQMEAHSNYADKASLLFIIVLLESAYFVNAGGLFYLSAILERINEVYRDSSSFVLNS